MEGREPAQGLGLQFYFRYGVLEMKNRVVGNQTMCKVGNQRRTIWRAGGQCRSCDYNSTSGLVSSVPTLLTPLQISATKPQFELSIIPRIKHINQNNQSKLIHPYMVVWWLSGWVRCLPSGGSQVQIPL